MTYKTILMHVDGAPSFKTRMEVAAKLAQRFQAHLIGLAPSGIAILPVGDYMGGSAPLMAQIQAQLDSAASSASADFDRQCKQLGIDAAEPRLMQSGPVDSMLVSARYVDLVLLGQPGDDRDPNAVGTGFVEQVLLGAGRPVLLIPSRGTPRSVGENIVVAWDASREAARAVTDALPFLNGAKRVEIAVVNAKKSYGLHGQEPGADIALFLARHGVAAEVKQLVTSIDVANTLLSHIADCGADMLVMGGYGHSRVREWVLGGVTRTILETMTVPVLMAH